MSYVRVIPRDFFNEAKLLKCHGKLSLGILDCVDGVNLCLEEEYDTESFEIDMSICGSLYVTNYSLHTANGMQVNLSTPVNSRSNWPLQFTTRYRNGDVFNDDGTFSHEFLKEVGALQEQAQ